MSSLDQPEAVHISTRSRSPSRRDVEANNAAYSRPIDFITRNHTVNDNNIPMTDFGVQKEMRADVLKIGSDRDDGGGDDTSRTREPTSVVQSWKEYVHILLISVSEVILHISKGTYVPCRILVSENYLSKKL